ncbi:MAG TPA: acetyl-CoA carboxylase biotin carboxylase subunit [Burkholderiaceae bacterium]|nr:acetyl-CoA carboxylase biotin carboxylase subunit [Burkholderiaceae bacterium]
MRKVFVANRGEIALRVVRACRELGIDSVVGWSDADRDSAAVRQATAALRLGPAPSRQSYLDGSLVVAAARATGCDAVHPGYGFLSEDADFARAVEAAGLIFVGPRPEHIDAMGDKIAAKRLAAANGVPLVPGGTIDDGLPPEALAAGLPYPVLLKAAAGGGGRGMRIVQAAAEFPAALASARLEAREAFGDSTVYWERLILRARHIEVQVLGDTHGTQVHLFERDCSLQRRHQKLVEESPSPVLEPAQRRELCEAALALVRGMRYRGAGTIEFLLDADRGTVHFIEMNTRIQVEHPVTEMVTGVDLVREQLRIAAGLPMSAHMTSASSLGHAIECRINAEDPACDFMPSPGRITRWRLPGGPGVRVDTHAHEGAVVPPYYDSMIAKLIVWDRDRESARLRMLRALSEFEIDGIATTIPLHLELLATPEFAGNRYHTRWIGERLAARREQTSEETAG